MFINSVTNKRCILACSVITFSNKRILYPDLITSRRNLDVSNDFQNGRDFFDHSLTETGNRSHVLLLTSPFFVDDG